LKNTLNVKLVTELAREGDSGLLSALESLVEVYKENKSSMFIPTIPVSLFAKTEMGILEVMVKVLKENYNINFSTIARLIGRDERTIWTAYSFSKLKHPDKFVLLEDMYTVPISIFKNRALGPLEALIVYLRTYYSLSFKEIAKKLNRSYRTVWLSYRKGKQKGGVIEVEKIN
jgi:hypothetical protein